MTIPEILSIIASVVGIIGGPTSMYFSWRAATRAGAAVDGADELAKRLTSRSLYNQVGDVIKNEGTK